MQDLDAYNPIKTNIQSFRKIMHVSFSNIKTQSILEA